jgi:hypothetical protein
MVFKNLLNNQLTNECVMLEKLKLWDKCVSLCSSGGTEKKLLAKINSSLVSPSEESIWQRVPAWKKVVSFWAMPSFMFHTVRSPSILLQERRWPTPSLRSHTVRNHELLFSPTWTTQTHTFVSHTQHSCMYKLDSY